MKRLIKAVVIDDTRGIGSYELRLSFSDDQPYAVTFMTGDPIEQIASLFIEFGVMLGRSDVKQDGAT